MIQEITPNLGGQIKDMRLEHGPKRQTYYKGGVIPDKMVKTTKQTNRNSKQQRQFRAMYVGII